MILTRAEFIDSMQQEVRILLHLAGKIDRTMIDYRPTPKQRSTLELLQYLSIMGPLLVRFATTGEFDPGAWTAAEQAAKARDLDQTIEAIRQHAEAYPSLLGKVSDEDLRTEISMFGQKSTRGAFLVRLVLCGYAAYRTQLFCYLKACGRLELSTMNLWAGMDAPAPV